MQSYIYTAQRGRLTQPTQSHKALSVYCVQFIGGCLKARNLQEAYNNARLLVRERKGNVTNLIVNKL